MEQDKKKSKPTPTLKDAERYIQQWRRLILNKPYLESLTGDVRQLADDLLKRKAIWIDENGIIRSTISGSKRLKQYEKKLLKRKREEERNTDGHNDRPNLRRHRS